MFKQMCIILSTAGLFACGGSDSTGVILGLDGTTNYTEEFIGTDGVVWSSDWVTSTGSAATAVDIQTNRGHLQGTAFDNISSETGLTRVINSAINLLDTDVTFTVEFEDFANQGMGFYLRQNGGYLTQSTPNGQGYAVFWEGDGVAELGLWREVDGVETLILAIPDPIVDGVVDGTVYRVRYQVEQTTATETTQRAKVWLASDAEPSAFNIQTISTFPELQLIRGGIAVDLFNYNGTASIFIDDINVTNLN